MPILVVANLILALVVMVMVMVASLIFILEHPKLFTVENAREILYYLSLKESVLKLKITITLALTLTLIQGQ